MDYFKNIIGYQNVKEELLDLLDMLNNSDKYAKFGVKPVKSVLLYGKPGVGKTTFAKDFIDATNRKLFILSRDGCETGFLKKMREFFNEVIENQPSILLLDDVDKYSNSDEMYRDTAEYTTLQTYLDKIKDEDVFVIATANDILKLPDSLKRSGRLGYQLKIDPPSVEDAEKIIKYYMGKFKNVAKDIDFEEFAQILSGCTCADIEYIMNKAGYLAAKANKDIIEYEDIVDASLRYIYDAPKLVSTRCPEFIEAAAIHECSHAIVSEMLRPGSVNMISVSNFDGFIGGLTFINKEKRKTNYDVREIEKNIEVLVAGKAGFELLNKTLDLGCHEDLAKAYEYTKKLIEIGYKGFKNIDIQYDEQSHSESIIEKNGSLASQIIEKYYKHARHIISNNISLLKELVKEMVAKGALSRKKFLTIYNNFKKEEH